MPQNYTTQTKIDQEFRFLDASVGNREKFQELSPRGLDISKEIIKPEVLPSGYRLVRIEQKDNNFVIAMLHDAEGMIVYYVDCVIIDDTFLKDKPITQVMVWRTQEPQHDSAVSGIAKKVFQNYLLDRYNVVASDSCQTREGKTFWVKQLLLALANDLFVYRYDRERCALERITDGEGIKTNDADLWGDADRYKNILALISKHQLPRA